MDPGDPARGALPLLLEALGAEASVVSQSFWEAQPEALEGFQGLLWWSDPAPWREPLGTAHRRRLEGWVASGKPLIWAAPSPEEGWAPSQPGGASLWEAAPLQARGRAALAALAELLGQAGDH
jgi:hypothetical protein